MAELLTSKDSSWIDSEDNKKRSISNTAKVGLNFNFY